MFCEHRVSSIIFDSRVPPRLPQVWAELAPGEADFLRAELGFFSAVTAVSGALYPVPKDQRRVAAADLVRKARPWPAQSPNL